MKKTPGWRIQSLKAHEQLTGPDSKARMQGLMPGYAHQAVKLAMAACKVAGMAKKRWRDADDRKMMLRDVKTLRTVVDAAFDEIERGLRAGTSGHTGVRNQEAAELAYVERGMQGLLALALMEEAGELAEPLHAVATGRSTFEDEKKAIEEEQADLRIYLHVACETARIDHLAATESKSRAFHERRPDLFSPDTSRRKDGPVLSMRDIVAAYAVLEQEARIKQDEAADVAAKNGVTTK